MATNPSRPDHPVLNASRARQGRYGRHVLLVLLASTALAALALFGAWTWQGGAPANSANTNGPIKSRADAGLFQHPDPNQMTRQSTPDNSTNAPPQNPPSGSAPPRP